MWDVCEQVCVAALECGDVDTAKVTISFAITLLILCLIEGVLWTTRTSIS